MKVPFAASSGGIPADSKTDSVGVYWDLQTGNEAPIGTASLESDYARELGNLLGDATISSVGARDRSEGAGRGAAVKVRHLERRAQQHGEQETRTGR